MKYTLTVETNNTACLQIVMSSLDKAAKSFASCGPDEMQYHYVVDDKGQCDHHSQINGQRCVKRKGHLVAHQYSV